LQLLLFNIIDDLSTVTSSHQHRSCEQGFDFRQLALIYQQIWYVQVLTLMLHFQLENFFTSNDA